LGTPSIPEIVSQKFRKVDRKIAWWNSAIIFLAVGPSKKHKMAQTAQMRQNCEDTSPMARLRVGKNVKEQV
jgi:hypothetical protein